VTTLRGVIDLHTHILPGVDDGADSLEEAVGLARTAWESGVSQLVATPHVRNDYPTTYEQIDEGLDKLREALAAAEVEVVVHQGAELDVELAATMHITELERLTFCGKSRYLLVEVPYSGTPQALEGLADKLRRNGIVPVLAHPERSGLFVDDPRRLVPFVQAGCLVQLTAGSLIGDAGRDVRTAAHQLLELQIVHIVASDSHGSAIRRSSLRDGVAGLDPGLAAHLTRTAPAAILANEPVELPPTPHRRRRWWQQVSTGR